MSDNTLQLRNAIMSVMKKLPDKRAVPFKVLTDALEILGEGHENESKVCDFVKLSPIHYGTGRKHKYWSIVFSAMSKPQALSLYLKQFPKEITQAQYRSIFIYVRKIFKLSEDETRDALKKFSIRANSSRRSLFVAPFMHSY